MSETPPPQIPDEKVCPFCAETIKAQAVICRYCGRDLTPGAVQPSLAAAAPAPPPPPSKKSSGCSVVFLIILCCFVALVVFGSIAGSQTNSSSGASTSSAPAVQETPTQLAADSLLAEYKANEVAADQRYKRHLVIVSGRIENIGKSVFGSPYVVIGGSGFNSTNCSFSQSDESTVARLRKGDRISIRGKVRGMTLGSVMLGECSIQ